MAFHVNRVLRECDFCMSMTQDRKSVSYQYAIMGNCFTKDVLESIMGNDYSPANNCVIAFHDVSQENQEKKVCPKNTIYWDKPQVVHLKWECTGTPTIFKGDYPIDYIATDSNGRQNCQCKPSSSSR